jgi:hypothetical protein
MRAIFPVTAGIAATALLGIGLTARGAVAPKSPSFAGTWQLSVNKSTYRPGPAPTSALLKVEYNGATRHSVLETVATDGEMTRTEYAAAEDGKDYPITGSPNADTIRLRRAAPGTIERVDKRRGHVVMLLTLRLSQDGRTMTVTQEGVTASGDMVSNTMVYEKR